VAAVALRRDAVRGCSSKGHARRSSKRRVADSRWSPHPRRSAAGRCSSSRSRLRRSRAGGRSVRAARLLAPRRRGAAARGTPRSPRPHRPAHGGRELARERFSFRGRFDRTPEKARREASRPRPAGQSAPTQPRRRCVEPARWRARRTLRQGTTRLLASGFRDESPSWSRSPCEPASTSRPCRRPACRLPGGSRW